MGLAAWHCLRHLQHATAHKTSWLSKLRAHRTRLLLTSEGPLVALHTCCALIPGLPHFVHPPPKQAAEGHRESAQLEERLLAAAGTAVRLKFAAEQGQVDRAEAWRQVLQQLGPAIDLAAELSDADQELIDDQAMLDALDPQLAQAVQAVEGASWRQRNWIGLTVGSVLAVVAVGWLRSKWRAGDVHEWFDTTSAVVHEHLIRPVSAIYHEVTTFSRRPPSSSLLHSICPSLTLHALYMSLALSAPVHLSAHVPHALLVLR